MTSAKPYRKQDNSEGSEKRSYRIHVSVKPLYFTIDVSCRSRKEAEEYAQEIAQNPFEGLDLETYVTWWIQEPKEHKSRPSSARRKPGRKRF